jgi:hypothetical protein
VRRVLTLVSGTGLLLAVVGCGSSNAIWVTCESPVSSQIILTVEKHAHMVIDLDRPATAVGGEYRPPTTKAD